MPAVYQGTRFAGGAEPIPNLDTPAGVGRTASSGKLDLLDRAQPRATPRSRPDAVRARRPHRSYELAFRMQAEAPEAVDLAQRDRRDTQRSTASTTRRPRASAATACWPAAWSSAACASCSSTAAPAASGTPTPTSRGTTPRLCRPIDQPIAGLLTDLKRRGLLDETLVIWGGEFGRTPMSEKGDGRDHNPYGFTMWLAGGGVKGGQRPSAPPTRSACTPSRTGSTSTTCTPRSCHLLGLDHMKLIYRHKGRPERADPQRGRGVPQAAGVTDAKDRRKPV